MKVVDIKKTGLESYIITVEKECRPCLALRFLGFKTKLCNATYWGNPYAWMYWPSNKPVSKDISEQLSKLYWERIRTNEYSPVI